MTRTAHATPAPLATYLRRATWGLPRKRQQEVWDELEEHVLTRADHLSLSGTPHEQALSQALRELGPPGRVSAGMTQVYLMPKMIVAATGVALAVSAALYAFAGGAEGGVTLPVLTQRPVKPSCVRGTKPSGPHLTIVSEKNGITCYTFNDEATYRGVYVSLKAVAQAIKSQGGSANFRTPRLLQAALPGGGTLGLHARFTQGGEGYVDASMLLSDLQTNQGIEFSGADLPKMHIGGTELQIGQGQQGAVGDAFYDSLAPVLAGRVLFPSQAQGRWPMSSVGFNLSHSPLHKIQTALPPGEVVMLISRNENRYSADTAAIEAGGRVALMASPTKLRFVTDPAQLSPYLSGGRSNALLVRVTHIPLNDLKRGIFLPAQPTSDATN